jgi:nucleoside-diphosphate-sugar epimerase
MKIAVLGAGGFLGKIICEYLRSNGHTVFAVTRRELTLTDYLSVQKWLEQTLPDAVVNCATSGGKQRMGDALLDDVQNNLTIFLNFYNNSQYFDKFINVGSGAEFDHSANIDLAKEDHILNVFPKDGYGYAKNTISRLCLEHSKFYTLRLFGCFDSSDPDFRLFKKFLNNDPLDLVDRKFDYFSAQDFCQVIDHYLNNQVEYRDINCVYKDKLYLSEILNKFKPVEILKKSNNNYTGDGSRLAKLKLKLNGLDKSIKEYKAL